MSSNKTVPVAEYRRAYDRLHRKVNDYHACCSAGEVSHWKEMTQRVLTEVSNISCSRAKPDDLENMVKARARVEGYLAAADERIEAYKRAA
ncbi:hypothetical protein QVM41_28130 [Pseudomonas shirazica]|uniref:hypothetical protein n=1 Tax=Pseudomonas shirazica TaxID=1940636 RepID=UPI0035259FEA